MSTTPPTPPNKPTIDERIEALTHSLELAVQETETMRERMLAMDARERQGRLAILVAIQAYIAALDAAQGPQS
jgi:hypothetical protein